MSAIRTYVGIDNKAVEIWDNTGGGDSGLTGTFTVRLDLNNSDPASWGSYLDDAVSMTVGAEEWDDFFGHYPCILADGVEGGKLNKNNYAQYEDGSAAPITTLGQDVMIAFPRHGMKIWKDSSYLYVSITSEEGKDGYVYYAFTYKGAACDKFYIGAYDAYGSGNKLYSTSGQAPTVSQTIGTFRTWAEARGTGYEQLAFYQLTYMQAMYLIKYRGQNAQIAIGRGFVDGNSAAHKTGTGNTLGMDYGETTGKVCCKLFGIEDFWGNVWQFTDGLWSNANRQLYASDGNYNDTGSGYTSLGTSSFSSNIGGYMKDVNGTSIAGFTPSSTSYGSETTYFCDNTDVYASRLASFGGVWNYAGIAGVFPLNVNLTASDAVARIGARLMFLHKQ